MRLETALDKLPAATARQILLTIVELAEQVVRWRLEDSPKAKAVRMLCEEFLHEQMTQVIEAEKANEKGGA